MSIVLKLSLSDDVAARLDSARGLHSRQEYVVNAIIAALDGSCIERELRAEIERLHQTLRIGRDPREIAVPDERLSW